MILATLCNSLIFVVTATATILIEDPSDVINPSDWAADNELLADYSITVGMSYLLTDIAATVHLDDIDANLTYASYSASGNDTSVISVAGASNITLSHGTLEKSGYSSNLNQASFYGVNAALNVANASQVAMDHINITVHNGAAGVYAYGTDTVVTVNNLWSYSSGPVSHGLYAGGNGTIYGANLRIFSGGMRSSAVSGDSPAGYVHIRDSFLHTAGIGSAIAYTLGEMHLTNVVGVAERAPATFLDGNQYASFTNVDFTAGLLAGTIQFSSATIQGGSVVSFVDSKLNVTGEDMPALWFGNVIGESYIVNTELVTKSGILVVANYSQVTQDFDYFASYTDNPDLSPAQASIYVTDSQLTGDLVAYNGSTISLNLDSHSSWTGTAYSGFGDVEFGVTLDATSNWTLTADTTLLNFTSVDESLSNINSGGFTLYYNATVNGWLNGQTVSLSGGGYAKPF